VDQPRRRPSRRKSSAYATTMADVAQAAGVSAQTVSRVLRHPETVSEETRARVNEAIRTTNYIQNFAASHLASNRSKTVAAIIPILSASIFAETVQGLNEVLLSEGYQVFLGHTDYRLEREEALVRSLSGRRPDGFFVIGTHHTRETTALLKRAGVPVVESWDWNVRPIDLLVGFSNKDAIRATVRYLAERGYGRPAFAGVVLPGDHRARERRDGFVAAIAEFFPHEPLRVVTRADRPMAMEAGAELLGLVRDAHPEADVIVFSSDLFASGALLACLKRGIKVPEQLAITGFGDYEIASQLRPSLTTVAVPTRRMGREAAQLLLRSMRHQPVEERMIDVGFELKIRESA
jgi:LacI family gluconate utilization system Gnt-I transcriptional repressor